MTERHQDLLGAGFDTEYPPGKTHTVVWFEPPSGLVMAPEIWIAAKGPAATWGGCQVVISEDDDDYRRGYVGQLHGGMTVGHLLDELPMTDGFGRQETPFRVRLYGPRRELPAVSVDDALARASLALVGHGPRGELVCTSTTRLVESSDEGATYECSDVTVRGCYGTRLASWKCAAHAVGTPFVRLDRTIFRYEYPPRMVGRTLYMKLAAQNAAGDEPEDFRGVDPIEIPIAGRFFQQDPRRLR